MSTQKNAALVTGAASGIGRSVALALARSGYDVAINYSRSESAAQSVAAEAAKSGARTLLVRCDVSDDGGVRAMLEQIRETFGRLDVLINNAGTTTETKPKDFEGMTVEEWDRVFAVNVRGLFLVTRAALPLLRAAVARNGSAVLANVGSIVGFFTTPLAGAYCASKAALHALTDALRMELAPFGIRVVCIQPGGVRSAFGDHAEAALRVPENSIYRAVENGIRARAQAGQRGATPAAAFAGPVVDALLRSRPPRVIRGGKNSFRLPLLRRFLPQAAFDAMLVKAFGLDRLKP